MMPYASSTDELVDFAVQAAAQAGVVHEGDLVVVTAGVPVGDVYKRQYVPLAPPRTGKASCGR